MKNIITAIGNEELNIALRMQKDINIKSQDIQYQEGIFEALDKYKDIDGIIVHEEIIGELELEDLIRSIIMLKNEIEIILITNQEEQFKLNENIVRIVNDNYNYVTDIQMYLCGNVYIKQENETKIDDIKQENETIQKDNIIPKRISIEKRERAITVVKSIKDKLKNIIKKPKNTSQIITVIGSSGVR